MAKARELTDTIADFEGTADLEQSEPATFARRAGLSGGETMWQARLVLSTLPPKSQLSKHLRTCIRRGDKEAADHILEDIYAHADEVDARPPVSGAWPVATRDSNSCTVLPPCPVAPHQKVS